MFVYRGREQLGFMPGPALAPAAAFPPVGVPLAIASVGTTLYQLFSNWWNRGELKVAATRRWDDFVARKQLQRAFYALRGGRMPTAGLPVRAGGSHFDPKSVAGMVEGCHLAEAQTFLDVLNRQMIEIAAKDQFFARAVNEHGLKAVADLQNAIDRARADCISPQLPPPIQVGPPGAPAIPAPGRPPGTTQAGMFSDQPLMWLGVSFAVGLVALAAARRKRRFKAKLL